MRTEVNETTWNKVLDNTGNDVLLSVENDARVYTATTGAAAPQGKFDGHVLSAGSALVIPFGLDVYCRARQDRAFVVTTDFGG